MSFIRLKSRCQQAHTPSEGYRAVSVFASASIPWLWDLASSSKAAVRHLTAAIDSALCPLFVSNLPLPPSYEGTSDTFKGCSDNSGQSPHHKILDLIFSAVSFAPASRD